MHVVATAGHVDHGKSTLVRRLTGMEPDRWAEERRRGMTLDLGFAWTVLEPGGQVAFVDVPGHERFVTTMLAGVGPVPAVLLVVAADGGWMPQTEEHVAALDALGVASAVVAVTRADLADARPVVADVAARLGRTSMAGAEVVAVAADDETGLDGLRAALGRLLTELPAPDGAAPVRLWVDRSFTIRGAGTVVTGTLAAGTLRVGDQLTLGQRPVVVRGLQTLGRPADVVTAVARAAVNLRGVDKDEVARGDALLGGGHWSMTDLVDVRLGGRAAGEERPAEELTLHIGSAAVPVRVRPLGESAARLRLGRALPLRAGDVGLLRDPARHVVVGRIEVVDPAPPPLERRGAAAARAAALAAPDAAEELRRRRIATVADLAALGLDPPVQPLAGQWLADPAHVVLLRARLADVVVRHGEDHPLDSGPTVEQVRRSLDLPDRALVEALVVDPLAVRAGRVVDTRRAALPAALVDPVGQVLDQLADAPFLAPEAGRLAALGLGGRELAAAERAGALLRLADGVVVRPDAPQAAVATLAGLPQPFTLSEARQALSTTRRVAVPLLELLDRRGLTRRLPDDRRTVVH